MAGGLHHQRNIGGTIPLADRRALLAQGAPAREQAVGSSPLSGPTACSPLSPAPSHLRPCGLCDRTPSRRCCLTLAATIMKGAAAGKFGDRTAPLGEAA